MRLAVRVVFVVGGVVAMLALGLTLGTTTLGVGHFKQPIEVESDKPLNRLLYRECSAADVEWWEAVPPTDKNLIGMDEAKRSDTGYTASIKFTTRSVGFRPAKYYNRSHLAVCLEFADGTRTCRVVTIPPDRGRTAIRLTVR